MKTLVCTAEPFGYGPSSSLAQIVAHVTAIAPGGSSRASYVGSGHTLDFAHAIAAYGGRVEAADRETRATRIAAADAVLIVTDFAAAEDAMASRTPFAIYDPLAWYWPEIPDVCRAAARYICQDFFGVRARVAGLPNAVVVPPLTPSGVARVPIAERAGIVISLGGLGNPYFTADKCVDYARAVLAALARATRGEPGPVTSLTSKAIAAALPGLSVATLAPAEVHRRIASARVCFLTPGLGQLYEASALGARAVWLPPANDSQGRQLREAVARGLAPGAIDWHEVMDVPRVDYRDAQDRVMRTLSAHMERLLHDPRAQARLAACVRLRMLAVRDAADDPLAHLAGEHGEGGAEIAARVIDRWLTGGEGAVGVPPENVVAELAPVVATLRALHAEIDGTGFHTLGGALEVARETRARTAHPTRDDFAAAHAGWRASGLSLFAKYGAGNCTALAEVLRARLQRATGLTGQILAVTYANSTRPLEHAWQYVGPVHADLLVPLAVGGRFAAVHVVCGLGAGDEHVHVFHDRDALAAHLDALGYTREPVIDPSALTRTAFGTKRRWWIVPEIGGATPRLGVDVIEGTIFTTGDGAVTIPMTEAAARHDELVAIGLRFGQPADFADNLAYLAANIEAWCDATLCEPGPTLRAARRRELGIGEPSLEVVHATVSGCSAFGRWRARAWVRALHGIAGPRARIVMAAAMLRSCRDDVPDPVELPDRDRAPSVLDVVPAGEEATVRGVRFDPARRAYVPARIAETVVHALHLRLAQFVEWEVPAIGVSASAELVERLVLLATDPVNGQPLLERGRIVRFVAALGDLDDRDPLGAGLRALRVDAWLTASAGGDRPERFDWELPPATLARLFEVCADRRGLAHVIELAAQAHAAEHAMIEGKRARLAAVLEQHRGTPRRHKRVHWAFVNFASVDQTTRELRGPGGVLPRDATTLEPESLRARYADAPRTAVRFVLDDHFDLTVLDDTRYWATIARWGFPPNHETLAAARPILASGYLTVERGTIVAIEDDGVMIPGKLGDGLPPIQEVLEALGYAIDLARVGDASLVIDWEAFVDGCAGGARLELPTDEVAEFLASRSHAERAGLAAAWIRTLGDRPRAIADGLRGFRLINVGGRAIAAGDLPAGAEWIDETLAAYLARKVFA